jgi:hypothetical protein
VAKDGLRIPPSRQDHLGKGIGGQAIVSGDRHEPLRADADAAASDVRAYEAAVEGALMFVAATAGQRAVGDLHHRNGIGDQGGAQQHWFRVRTRDAQVATRVHYCLDVCRKIHSDHCTIDSVAFSDPAEIDPQGFQKPNDIVFDNDIAP